MDDVLKQYRKEVDEELSKLSFEEIWAINVGKKINRLIHSSEIYYWLIEYIDKYEEEIISKSEENALQVLLHGYDIAMPKGFDFFLEQLVCEVKGHRKWAALALLKIDSREVRKAVWQIRQSHELESQEATAAFRIMLDDIFGWDICSQR